MINKLIYTGVNINILPQTVHNLDINIYPTHLGCIGIGECVFYKNGVNNFIEALEKKEINKKYTIPHGCYNADRITIEYKPSLKLYEIRVSLFNGVPDVHHFFITPTVSSELIKILKTYNKNNKNNWG